MADRRENEAKASDRVIVENYFVSCTEGDEVGSPSAERARSEGALGGCRETTRKGPVRGRARSAVWKVREKEWE